MSFSMPPRRRVLAPGGLRVQERQNSDREGRRGEERGDDEAEAKHDSPAAQAPHLGLGRRRGVKIVRLYSRVEAREALYSILVALGSGALEPVSGFAEVDFRAFSVPVTHANVELSRGIALICREREVPDRLFKFLLRMKESP